MFSLQTLHKRILSSIPDIDIETEVACIPIRFEPGREKTCRPDFQLGITQTRLHNYRRWPKACDF